ncbi:MAG: TIR domain-containing protein [Pseudomonadota bacterium]
MAEIFVSYSQNDKARVRLIAETLEAEGLDVFWDPEIPPGETWDNVIARELKAARCVIVVWSEASGKSDWVKEEADFGKRMKALVPVQIDRSGPPLGFSRIQTANLTDWTGDPNDLEWRKVLDRVRHHGADTSQAGETPETETQQAARLRDALYDGAQPQQRSQQPPPPQQDRARRPQPVQPTAFQQPHGHGQQQGASGYGGASRGFTAAAGTATATGGGAGDKASEFNFQYAFFQPKGRLAQKPFWIGFAMLFGLSTLAGMLGAAGPAVAVILSVVLIYPGICLYGKRLHDFGMSAWIYGAYLVGTFLMGAVIGGIMGAEGAYPDEIMITTAVISFFVAVGFALWVGLMPSQQRENKHGPVPGSSGVAQTFG